MKVAVIIPAFNEEARIRRVLEAVTLCALAHEIIVVCDGSTDRTAEVAASFSQVKVINLPFNVGKGGAMATGAANTNADIVVFVDGDLQGLKPEHVDKIIQPVLSGLTLMCIGVFRGGKFWSTTAQRITPYISGQRAMRRSFFLSIPNIAESKMGVEVTINAYAKRQGIKVQKVVLRGVANTIKEHKLGLMKGTAARTKMYAEIAKAMVRARKKKPKRVRSR